MGRKRGDAAPMELNISLQPKQRNALKVAENSPVTFYGGA